MSRDRWWTDIPQSVLAEEKSQDTAKLWATNQRSVAAKAWADTLRQDAMDTFAELTKSAPPEPGGDKLLEGQGAYTRQDASLAPEAPSPLDTVRGLVDQGVQGAGRAFGAAGEALSTAARGLPGGDVAVDFLQSGARERAYRRDQTPLEASLDKPPDPLDEQINIAMGISGNGLAKVGQKAVGAVTAKLASKVQPNASMGQPVSATRAAIRKMYLEPEKLPGDRTTPGAIERVRRDIVRNLTDERVDLNELVNEARKVIARPLTSAEEVGEIVRKNAPMAAAQRAQEQLKPVFTTVRQVLGDDGPVQLRELLTYQDNIDKAAAIGRRAGPQAEAARAFSGDVDVAKSQQARDELLSQLSPEQRDVLEAAAQKVWDIPHEILRRKAEAGILAQEYVDDLIAKFPHYVPVQIVDHIPAAGSKGGKGSKIGLSSQDIRRLTEEGSAAARRDPIESVVDLMFRAEGDINANQAFTGLLKLKEQVPEIGRFFKEVPSDYTAKTGRGEQVLEGFVDGEKVRYAVPYDLHQAVTMANKTGEAWAPMQTFLSIWRNLVTGANATFVAANAPLDAMTYVIRQASREGGPQHIPSVAKSLLSAYGEVFQGLGKQEIGGKAAEFIKEGGGVFGMTQRTPAKLTQFTQGLDRPNPLTIRNVGDIGRIAKDILTLQPVQAVAERVELAPRVASFNRAQAAGKRTQEAMIGGRDVTLDFQRAGTVTRVLNSYIPFFNVAAQSGVNIPRAIKENPKGAAYTIGAAVATPTLLTELWNRSDPDRAAAYEDVPDYIKRRSLVVMLPFTPGVDDRGNPRPPFVEIRLREMMGIAAPLRAATAKILGDDKEGLDELALTMLANVTPLNYSSAGEIPFEFMGPGVGTAAQLGANVDTFRQRPIATEFADENAAEISKAAARMLGGRPSQWEFAAKNLLGTYAQMGLPASNILAGRPRRETGAIQDIPIAGGLLRKMGGVLGGIGAETGQKLADAQKGRALPTDITKALAEAGIRYEPGPLRGEYEGIPMTRSEQAKAQDTNNKEFVARLREVIKDPEWPSLSADQKEQEIRRIAGEVREEAAVSVLEPLSEDEMIGRYERERQRVESRK